VDTLHAMIESGAPVTVIDVRRWSAYDASGRKIVGSLRIPIDELQSRAREIPRARPAVLSCA
jgi:rhodanese-related sulfurtransferase